MKSHHPLRWFPLLALVVNCSGPATPVQPPDAPTAAAVPPSPTVAGTPLTTPQGCKVERLDERSGAIRCDRAVLDWLNGTGNAIEEIEQQIVDNGFHIVERFDGATCRLGNTDGQGVVFTVEQGGHAFPMFTCVVPFRGAYTVARCSGYDPRVAPAGEPKVPDPCGQVMPWQPVLTAPVPQPATDPGVDPDEDPGADPDADPDAEPDPAMDTDEDTG